MPVLASDVVPSARMWPRLWPLMAVVLALVSTTASYVQRGPEPPGIMASPFSWDLVDAALFARYGESLISGDAAAVYRDPINQAGPLQVFADGLLGRLANALGGNGGSGSFVVELLVACSVLLAFGLTAHVLVSAAQRNGFYSRWTPWIPSTVTALAFLWNAPTVVAASGHWWQITVLGCWWAAGYLAGQGRIWIAGAVVGVTMWLEPWGVLGIITLMLAPTVGMRVRAWGGAVVVGALGWLPFVIQPRFALPEFQWTVREGSGWSVLFTVGDAFPWSARLAQTAIIVGLAVLVAFRVGPRLNPVWASWLIPPIIVLLRIGTDTWCASYYWTAAQVFLLPAALLVTSLEWRRGLPLLAAAWLTFTGWSFLSPFLCAWLALAPLAAVFLASRLRPKCAGRLAADRCQAVTHGGG